MLFHGDTDFNFKRTAWKAKISQFVAFGKKWGYKVEILRSSKTS
jgi:hypothetical protein